MAGWHHQGNGHELGQVLGDGDREAWCVAVHGVAVGYDLVTEQFFKSNFVAINLRPFFCMLTLVQVCSISHEFLLVCCQCVCVSCSVMSDSLWPHGLQPARLLYPMLSIHLF